MAKIPKPLPPTVKVGIVDQTTVDPNAEMLWAPQPGPQTDVMCAQEFEVFFGGAKGGGKSFVIIGWLIRGNYVANPTDPIDVTYLNCPHYRALVIRKNLEDLNSWISEANRIYARMGANYTQKPNEFTFPSGAKIIMGHMDDDRAVEKYFGNVVHRVAVDELTFIGDIANYTKLLSCVRSNIKGVKPQMLLTGNPGGPGTAWVKDRFVEPKDANGDVIPPRTRIVDKAWNPFTKKVEEMDRIFIPSKLIDNPELIKTDPLYYTRLAMGLSDVQRRAYLEGDWSASGTFFDNFRPRHLESEPPEACHVIPTGSRNLLPWLPRFAGCDWGFGHAAVVYGAVRDQNKQIIVHRELVLKNTDSVELGYAIGQLFLPDLEGLYRAGCTPLLTLWLSPDAFAKRDVVKTQAEGIAEGISRILGSKAVHLPGLFTLETGRIESDLFREMRMQEKCGIVISQAQNARRAGASYLRELLRWKQIAPVSGEMFDETRAYQLQHESMEKYKLYMEAFKRREPEVLPKMLIESHCRNLIESIPSLVADEKDLEDVMKTEALSDDVYDAWRYLLFSPDVLENREPQRSFVHRQLARVKEHNPGIDYNSLVWAAREAESQYARQSLVSNPFSVSVESSRHSRSRRVQ